MAIKTIFQRVSQAPTNPKPGVPTKTFDVAELYSGPVAELEARPDRL
jgi:MoxR-like ATPase